MSKRNVILGAVVALAVVVGGCSKETETRLCNPGTVLVHFACSETLGEVSGTAALEGLSGQMTTKSFNLTCPGSYNLEVNVTGYAKNGKIKAVVSANAGDVILAKDKLVEIPLDDGCTKFDLALGSPDALNKIDAAVVTNTDDGGTKIVDGEDGGVTPDADMTSLGVARGGSCARNDQCTDGHCADGVCCDTACDGVCMACTIEKTGSQTGQCSLTKSGVKHSKCDTKAANSCGTNGMCNGAGKCSFWDSTNECVAAACNAGDFVPAQKCSGAGACQAASPSKCGEYACTAQGCKTSCAVAGDCSAGVQCIGGKCGGKRALGEACSANSECTSPGFCVDGVCCGAKCDGKCEACSAAISGGNNGECLPVPASKGNQADCAVQSAASCGTTGRCDGARKCEFHASGTECAGQMCSVAGFTPARKCDGGGTCLGVNVTTCGAYICASGNCKNPCAVDGDCVAGNFCSNGTCTAKRDNGGSCSSGGGNQCNSGICEGGNCCNVACSGKCRSCSTGTCSDLCPLTELSTIASLTGHVNSKIGPSAGAELIFVGSSALTYGSSSYWRGLVTFDLSTIPTGAVLQTATLSGTISGNGVSGTPFDTLGSLNVQHVDYGPSLETSDISGSSLGAPLIFATSGTTLDAPVSISVTDWVLDDLFSSNRVARMNRSQFRFAFSTMVDNGGSLNLQRASIRLTVSVRLP